MITIKIGLAEARYLLSLTRVLARTHQRWQSLARQIEAGLAQAEGGPEEGECASDQAGAAPDPLARLSPREQEILQLVIEGQSSADIATKLCLSPKTVETYRSRLMQKLDLSHLPGLVKFAIQRGLTSLE